MRRTGARNQDRSDHQVSVLDGLVKVVGRRVAGADPGAEFGVEIAQALQIDIEDGDNRAHAGRDLGGVASGGATPDHDHLGGCDAGHPAHQHAAPTVCAHQVIGADLGGETTSNLTHRCQQWQRAVRGLDSLVSDRGNTGGQQRVGAGTRRRQVQVGEQGLARMQQSVFRRGRLFDLQ